MRVGIRGHDLGAHPPEKLIALYRAHGVKTVQLAVPKAVAGVESYNRLPDALLQKLDTLLRDAGIEVAVLGCYIEPALEDPAARAAQVETFRWGIRAASALGAGCIGTETTNFVGDEAARAAAFDRLCSSLDPMLAEGKKYGVTVAVEPVARHTLNTPLLVERLLQRFGRTELAVIFDPVNLLTAQNFTGQQALWQACLETFGPQISAVHVKDAQVASGQLSSCALGSGVMDFEPVIVHWLRRHKPDIALLREETSLATIGQDLRWMRNIF